MTYHDDDYSAHEMSAAEFHEESSFDVRQAAVVEIGVGTVTALVGIELLRDPIFIESAVCGVGSIAVAASVLSREVCSD